MILNCLSSEPYSYYCCSTRFLRYSDINSSKTLAPFSVEMPRIDYLKVDIRPKDTLLYPRLKERHRLLRVTFTTVFHHRIYLRIFLYILEEALVGLMKDLDAFLKDSKYHFQHIVGLLVYLLQVFVSFGLLLQNTLLQ